MAKHKAADPGRYDSDDLSRLVGLDAVRKRPGMYVGSTDDEGVTHCVFELVDNCVDEVLAGFCDEVTVTRHPDGSVTVADNGRGIPVAAEPETGLSGVEFVLTNLHAGAKFGGSGYKVSGGLHGVGASAVNALGARMDVTVWRDGYEHLVQFHAGNAGVFHEDGFVEGAGLRRGKKVRKARTGTNIRWWPDLGVFQTGAQVQWDRVTARLRQSAFLLPNVVFRLVDETEPGRSAEWVSGDGLAGLVGDALGPDIPVIAFRHVGMVRGRQMQLVDGALTGVEVDRPVDIEVALGWGSGEGSQVHGFVNVVETPGGGSHVTGLERAVLRAVHDALSGTRLIRAGEELPGREDVGDGLVAAVAVRVSEPEFVGQTKSQLSEQQIGQLVARVVGEELRSWFAAARNRKAGRVVLARIVALGRQRQALKHRRVLAQRKTVMESSGLPDKLKDCRSRDTTRTELLLIEGDSAAGTVGNARDAEFQAYLPLRGKILNVLRTGEKEMLANAECAALLTAVGGGIGADFDSGKARYGKLVLLADADVDGSHIRCLLLTMVWRYMRPLLLDGRVFAAMPPLFHVHLVGGGERWAFNDADLRAVLARVKGDGLRVRHIQRLKGLGEMSVEQLAVTTIDPATRRMRQITVGDAEEADRLFETLMGREVPARRAFIYEQSNGFEAAQLDV